MNPDRDAVLAYWREHPHLSDRQVNEHFGGVFNRNTLRTWKRAMVGAAAAVATSTQGSQPINGHNQPTQLPLVMPPPPAASERYDPEELRDLGLTEEEIASEDMVQHAAMSSGLTPELKTRIVKFLRAGSPQGVAARRVGVGEVTFYKWKKQGRADEVAGVQSIHREFYEETERAVAEVETKLVRSMMTLAKGGDFKAIKYMLESRFPSRWRQHKIVEHQTPDAQPGASLVVHVHALATQLAAMTPEQLAAMTGRPLDGPLLLDVDPEPLAAGEK